MACKKCGTENGVFYDGFCNTCYEKQMIIYRGENKQRRKMQRCYHCGLECEYIEEAEKKKEYEKRLKKKINELILGCGNVIGDPWTDGIRFAAGEIKKELKK